ncbi:MAG: recombinase RecT [Synergistes jonesii]|uniref:recombinase RecT n=1 Tax=Synergistes jonesii TaxID=2754 RepID=UPI002A74C47B|nr:recombinase RecT [Synergistes jonesii]MDY2985917.1 recombinase RecT [Synergistes jonesii]
MTSKANEAAKAAAIAIQNKVKEGRPLIVNEFKLVVEGFKTQIEAALPMHLKKNAEKYARQALTLFSENPKLQQASPITILSALMKASSLGLDLNPQLGQCYIIPYDNKKKIGDDWAVVTEAQFQIGYRGAICLAQRSNRVARIAADVVRLGDRFEYAKGLFPKLEHIPADGQRGDITHVYALANFTNGGYAFEVWTRGQVEEHAQRFSKSYYKWDVKTRRRVVNPNSTWVTHFESMAKKTLIMAIWKYLPIETELLLAGAQDETTVSSLPYVADERDVLSIMPDKDSYIEAEVLEEAPAQEVKQAPGTSAAPEHSEALRILRDNLGDFGLGLNEREIAARVKKRFGKKFEELTETEATTLNNEVVEELRNRT